MERQLRIGFIGLGIMGSPMCKNIMKAGFPMSVYDVDREKMSPFLANGAQTGDCPADVAEKSDVIITMLPNNNHVEEVVLGSGGIIEKTAVGKIIVDMSTISPSVSKRIACKVAERGGLMADAPVVKSQPAAVTGDLGILVGGPKEVYDIILPVLHCMGKNIIHMGSNGSGLVMKLCHNLLVGEISVAVSGMLTAAQRAGLEFDDIVAAVSYGGGQNFYLDSKGSAIKNRDFTVKFPLQYMSKDLGLALEMCESLGLDLEEARNADKLYRNAVKSSFGNLDFSAVINVVGK